MSRRLTNTNNPNQGSKSKSTDKCLTNESNPNEGSQSTPGKSTSFQMPLHYPRYKEIDYETMPEDRLDCLFKAYGLPVFGDVNEKRKFAMGAFLWPSDKDKRE
ncbi:hypothetical protein Tsubulata_005658 [Turnera subulata]|uniref:DUF7722 domain-containing protein n=1 Tax=Turnera subulata TaxID=218843 RepID=A0A9Q0F373_9ROSI|nr:hypothetical protein Tsubulata_005658 [Turnera subulata]